MVDLKHYKFFLRGAFLLAYSQVCFSFTWQDLWQRADERDYRALQSSIVHYRNQHFESAAKLLSTQDTALAHYNRGNALAKLGQYEEAIQAYEAALKKDSNYPDAQHNIDVLKKLLEKQKKDKEQQKDKSEQKDNEQQKDKPQQKDNEQKNQQQKKQEQESAQQNTVENNKAEEKKESAQANQKIDPGVKQWLKQVPDDPGGLLRHKFLRDYQRRHAL